MSIKDAENLNRPEILYQEELLRREMDRPGAFALSRVNLTKRKVEEFIIDNELRSWKGVSRSLDYKTRTMEYLGKSFISEEENKALSVDEILKRHEEGIDHYESKYIGETQSGKLTVIKASVNVMENPVSKEVRAFLYTRDITDEWALEKTSKKIMENSFDFLVVAHLKEKTVKKVFISKESRFIYNVGDDYDTILIANVKNFVREDEREKTLKNLQRKNIERQLEREEKYSCLINMNYDSVEGNKRLQIGYASRKLNIIWIACEDVTRKLRKEEEQRERLAKALDEAEQANVAKGSFLARMSHDMRTPMNAIMGMTHLALEEIDDKEAVKEYLKQIESSSTFLLALINDLLDMEKINSNTMELNPVPYSYREFNQLIESMFKPLCEEKGITLDMHQGDMNPTVFVDKTRYNQIFFNILSNAVKFTPPGGRIDHYTVIKDVKDNVATIECHFIDTGIGMSEEFQEHMFEPFSQEKTDISLERKGTGLGLPISKSLARLMGGDLCVKSKKGEGTEVIVTIPLPFTYDYKAPEEEEPKFDTHRLIGKKALIAEDQALNSEILEKLLKHKGMEVISTCNGKECVKTFEEYPEGYFDVILMDIRMPEMDGLAATRTIRNLNRKDAKRIPIIAMTANAYESDKKNSYDAGMDAHLSKPTNPELLYETIGRLTEKG